MIADRRVSSPESRNEAPIRFPSIGIISRFPRGFVRRLNGTTPAFENVMVENTESKARVSSPRYVLSALADENAIPFELVERIYDEEFEKLRQRSRVVTFVSILAARRVRDRLSRGGVRRARLLKADH